MSNTPPARWRKDKNFELEDLYLKLERLIDVLLIRGETKVVQEIERKRMVAEGDVEKMTDLCTEYAEVVWANLAR
jgi:hypothetical protein